VTNKQRQATAGRLALSLYLIAAMVFAGPAFADDKKSKYDAGAEGLRQLRSPVTNSLTPVGGAWSAQGPAPIYGGQSENIPNNPVSGAINAVVAHPTNADILWVGSVNGGIWKTTNATNAPPTWTSQTDAVGSLSIGGMVLDPADGTHATLVAVTSGVSSYYEHSGPRGRILRTTNGGSSWTELAPAALAGQKISSIAVRGATILAGVDDCSSGVLRSTNTGSSFSAVTGLSPGSAYDVIGDPSSTTTYYAAVSDCSGTNLGGVFKSTNSGSSWTRLSHATINSQMSNSANAELAFGASGSLYVGIVSNTNNRLSGIFRSTNGGTSWTQLDTPTTVDQGVTNGVHPGAQGGIHFSLGADPFNSSIVYVGGDRQPDQFPRANGAWDYSGRLFRVDASASPGAQDTSLTHCSSATAACNNVVSTNNNSAPHADSRGITFDANGDLIEVDDGGVFRRTNPDGTGDWESLNGNLQITELHSIAWDRLSNMIIGGAQDNGTSEQTTAGGTEWSSVDGGDGGDVSVDDTTSASVSTRYNSSQNLGSFRRRHLDSNGTVVGFTFPQKVVTGGGASLIPQFTTPVELNRVDARRMLIAGDNDLYESLDRGDTMTALGLNRWVEAMVYGGRSGASDNLDVIWAISPQGPGGTWGPFVYMRSSGGGAPTQTSTQPGTGYLRDITVDSTDWTKAYVVNESGQVFSTSNSGATWTNITGNLGSGTNDLRTITFIPGSPSIVAVGGLNGVFRMATNNVGVWNQFGTGLTNAIVYDLDYDALDDTLVASTLGRGAWKIASVITSGSLPTVSVNDVAVAEGNSGSANATFTVSLSAPSSYTVDVDYAATNGSATAQTTTFSNTSSISIPDSGEASPFPSTISVSGVSATVANVAVTLNNLSHSYPDDLDILLVSPGGRRIMLMSDAGGGSPGVSNVNVSFDDTAAATVPFALTTGTYRPTDEEFGEQFQSPAPSPWYDDTLSSLAGVSPNGTWSLYIVDDATGDFGSVAGGWSLTFTTAGDYFPSRGSLTFNPGVTSRTFTVPVTGDTTAEITETFNVTLSNPINATIADGTGVGTITNDDAITAPTSVVATATTSTNVQVTWTAAAVANAYRVYRSSNGSTYAQVGTDVASSPFNDPTAAAGTSYLYKVRAVAGVESPDSNIDLATTVIFTDPTLTVGSTLVQLAHFTELLTAVNAVRALAGSGTYPAISFSAPAPSTSVTVRAAHLTDLRNGITAPRNALLGGSLTFTDPTITAGTTLIKAVHINELRNAVK